MGQFGCRLCFIDDNTFIFQPYDKDQMNVFEMNSTNKQYTMTKYIPVKGGLDKYLFPQQYKIKMYPCEQKWIIGEFNKEKTKWRFYIRVIY
ncbi:unnamed protein product [Paramecium sonneborni]|uniref:Uncharacterized protein n=1 Tax=Paramecium sonneborni TaxID=65129 RepID=A0A8S1RQQ5_9CILI|nr:unnamed protein product [Paramecium sonneborni]